MELSQIKAHWTHWARSFKQDLRATTKTPSIKALEIAALARAFGRLGLDSRGPARVLEVGCGNGHNCFALAPTYPHWQFTGVDFIPEMVAHAREGRDQCPHPENLHFCQGNLLDLEANASLESGYELVFTDRCLINLNSHELQMQGVDQLRAKVSTGGYLVLIENIARTHDRQNELRQALGLEARIPDTFNLFLDESRFLDHVQGKLELIHRECFASLHDIILYVLVPMVNGGRVDYDHPMVGAVTQLLHSQKGELDHELAGAFGEFGQNCLYVFKKI